jgi:hypothetical protein
MADKTSVAPPTGDLPLAAQPWLASRVPHWGDPGWWETQIDAAAGTPYPALCNLRVTLTHYELSLALHSVTGPASGANFHTWAVWGSKQAGHTIRRDDVPFVPVAAAGLGAALGVGASGGFTCGSLGRRVATSLAGGVVGAVALNRGAEALLGSAAGQILGGNVTVLAEIGRQSARFVSAFARPDDRTEQRLEDFLGGLRPGPASEGGQELLRGAYRHYFDASREADPDRRDELMLCANLLAILQEHERLEPYIDASMPHPFRRLVTERILGFTVGAQAMRVDQDVSAAGRSPFPETLRTIESPDLRALLDGPHGWDRTPDSLAGSAAHDWTKLSDRMNFIVDLFRTRQSDPSVFTPPYAAWQREMIVAGDVPTGPL